MAEWTPADERLDVPYNSTTSFVCVEHPAVVKNVDKALRTIGGVEGIAETYSNPAKRLPLRWRPGDIYCKAAYGDLHKTTSLLLRVKRRRRRGTEQYEYKAEVLGRCEAVYKYQGMCDFQYLPMVKTDSGQYKNIYHQVVAEKVADRTEFFSRDAPLFIPPCLFSRSDFPCDSLYRADIERNEDKNPDAKRPAHLIGTVRKRRSIYTIFVNYGEALPTEPIDGAMEKLESQFVDPLWEKELRKLMEEKPLWLKAEIEHRVTFNPDKLKFLLPVLCFYWLDGPWRAQWNRFGFDPNKNPGAKIYQTLDFRVRQAPLLSIKAKRSDQRSSLWSNLQRHRPQAAKISFSKDQNKPSTSTEPVDRELTYIFKPNRVPPNRLMYYQLGQIQLEGVQALLHANDGMEKHCTEKDGWCIKDMYGQSRDIMHRHLVDMMVRGQTAQESVTAKLKKSRMNLEDSDEEHLETVERHEDMDLMINQEETGADNQGSQGAGNQEMCTDASGVLEAAMEDVG